VGVVEVAAIVIGTVLLRRSVVFVAPRRFSVLRPRGLIGLTATSLVIAFWTNQYNLAERLDELTREEWRTHHICVDFVPPLLGVAPWYRQAPLLFGLLCLSYATIEGVLWAIGKAIGS